MKKRRKKWERFTRDEIELLITESNSYRDVADKIGYTGATKNQKVREMIDELGIDASHLNNNAKKGTFDYSKFIYGHNVKNAMPAIAAIRGRKCEMCGLETWMGQPISLEVHHKDGDRLNNDLSNLQLLCLNCHATTYNWRRKKTKICDDECVTDDMIIEAMNGENTSIMEILMKVGLSDHGSNYTRVKGIANKLGIILPSKTAEHNYCVDCGKEIYKTSTRCTECNNRLAIQNWKDSHDVNRDQLKMMIRNMPISQIAKKFNISDATVKKWCKKFNLPYRKRDINLMSDDDWELI